jgi:hypothetical protein
MYTFIFEKKNIVFGHISLYSFTASHKVIFTSVREPLGFSCCELLLLEAGS